MKLSGFILLVFVGAALYTPAKSQATSNIKDTITVIGVGDMMLGSGFPSASHLPPNDDCDALLKPVWHILQNADVTFGNLEGCFLNSGPTTKKCSDPSRCYAFRMPDRYVHGYLNAGFDVVSLANNHSGDFGEAGRNNTMKLLDSVGINYGGLLVHPTASFMIDSVKYGFCAFAPNSGTCDVRDIVSAAEIVKKLKAENDIVIISFHAGAEGSSRQHVTRKTEEFIGENRGNVYEFAHSMIDAGADVLFGHGPHVTRAVELYKERFIIYSMGNFCTYSQFNLAGVSGLAPIVKVFMNNKGEFLKAEVTPTIQVGEGGSNIDSQKRVIKVIQDLTATDFPEGVLNISNDGLITKK
ncbi:MAG: capsule biosynthesis protein CapA [Bacteroidetes bacterium GWF2_38_335]|nr:MAG: capsule biosynthesis protein CapA [Bacteroidetes bacterium GWF2_38_335]OFY80106.1 MAG: capsule biosynthesis protein CapA [Bacteroidetes bacterium RIFOXYA12_FULL_38_20]HBS88567.1 capsule biosynthesis protein CapA [Bacteroidales bacterium]